MLQPAVSRRPQRMVRRALFRSKQLLAEVLAKIAVASMSRTKCLISMYQLPRMEIVSCTWICSELRKLVLG